jgi:hypothetical protein
VIQGIDIKLLQKTVSGYDWSNQPIYDLEWVTVENVLVGEPTSDDVIQSQELYGKKVCYTLAIPKGDDHIWENTQIELPEPFAGVYNTIGIPTAGIEANIPLKWNKKVKIERYEQDQS